VDLTVNRGEQDSSADIRVLVAGPDGKMGAAMMVGLPKVPGIEVVGGLRRDDARASELLADADVLVDFTIADSAVELMLGAIDAGVRPVSGTSGLTEDDLRLVDEAARARGIPAVWASQMTIGGALMMHFCRLASRFIDNVTVVEAHHATKADAPSGTAWELARRIREAHGSELADYPSAHQPVEGVLGGLEGGVRIHSMRMPGILGWNEVTFAGHGEVLSIKQTDGSRDAFPPFVGRAVHEVMQTDRVGLIRGYGAVVGLAELAAAELGLDVTAPHSA
jgi:4-hydroxy-tetrahydrodipicolinate reductase